MAVRVLARPLRIGALTLTLLLCLVAGLLGRSPARSALAGSSEPYAVTTDLAYAPAVGSGHLLDIYVPTHGKGPFPAILYQVGSAFTSDDTKGGFPGIDTTPASLAERWASKGYVVVGYNTRSSSEAKFPEELYDVKSAIRYVRAKADRYEIDPKEIGIIGTSSGAWSASMAGLTGGVKRLEGTVGGHLNRSSSVQAVADLFGPTDFLTMDSERIAGGQQHDPASSPESQLIGCALQECKDTARAASPVTYVDRHDPPFYISHGTDDPLIAPGQSKELFKDLRKACDPARLTLVPGYGHTDSYFSSADLSPGRKVRTARNCHVKSSSSPAPTYGTLLAFFNHALKH